MKPRVIEQSKFKFQNLNKLFSAISSFQKASFHSHSGGKIEIILHILHFSINKLSEKVIFSFYLKSSLCLKKANFGSDDSDESGKL